MKSRGTHSVRSGALVLAAALVAPLVVIVPPAGADPDTMGAVPSQHVNHLTAAQTGRDGLAVTMQLRIALTGLPGTGLVTLDSGDGGVVRFSDGMVDGEYQGDATGTQPFESDNRTLTWKRTKKPSLSIPTAATPIMFEVTYSYTSADRFWTTWTACCYIGGRNVATEATASVEPTLSAVNDAPGNVRASTEPEGGRIEVWWERPQTSEESGWISGYRIRRSRSPGGPAEIIDLLYDAGGYVDDGLPNDATFSYRVSTLGPAGEGPSSPAVSASTLPVVSDDCKGGTTLVASAGGDADLRIVVRDADERTTWLCLSVAAGPVARGGKLVLTSPDPQNLQPTADEQSRACETPSGNTSPLPPSIVEIGDESDPATHALLYVSFLVSRTEVWTCVEATHAGSSVKRRVVIPASASVAYILDPDNATTSPRPDAGGAESAQCTADGQTVLLHDLGTASVLVGARQASSDSVDLCVRVEGPVAAGGRLELTSSDTSFNGIQTETGPTAPRCSTNVVTVGAVSIRRGADAGSVSLCVFTGTEWTTVTAGTQSPPTPAAVRWWPD